MTQSADWAELGENKLARMAQCSVSSSTDVNNNNNNHTAGYFRSLSSSSDCVTSTSDCRLRIETTNFRKITPETESVSSTTEEYNFENVKLIKELIIDVIH